MARKLNNTEAQNLTKIANIRRIVTYCEETFIDGGKEAQVPLKLFAVAAILVNPWRDSKFVEDLRPQINVLTPIIGDILVKKMVELVGAGSKIEAFGKAAVVGMAGEIEHAAALIHTLRFGNIYRKATKADTSLAFTQTRGGPNCPITIPLMHKLEPTKRSHYLTIQFAVTDAPAPDEIIVAIGASDGGRLHHRIGSGAQDLLELGTYGE